MNQNRGKFRREEKIFELMIDEEMWGKVMKQEKKKNDTTGLKAKQFLYYNIFSSYLSSKGIFVFLEELINLPGLVALLKLLGRKSKP